MRALFLFLCVATHTVSGFDNGGEPASCASWAQSGECERNPDYMSLTCKEACAAAAVAAATEAVPASGAAKDEEERAHFEAAAEMWAAAGIGQMGADGRMMEEDSSSSMWFVSTCGITLALAVLVGAVLLYSALPKEESVPEAAPEKPAVPVTAKAVAETDAPAVVEETAPMAAQAAAQIATAPTAAEANGSEPVHLGVVEALASMPAAVANQAVAAFSEKVAKSETDEAVRSKAVAAFSSAMAEVSAATVAGGEEEDEDALSDDEGATGTSGVAATGTDVMSGSASVEDDEPDSGERKGGLLTIVSHAEIDKSSGFTGKPFVSYTLRVCPGGWNVQKRFSQFDKLDQDLRQTCASAMRACSASLPPKFRFPGPLAVEGEERMAPLQQYLTSLLTVPEIRTSEPVLTFIGADCDVVRRRVWEAAVCKL